jgi:F1F0 ATPase subunit 2
MNDVTALLLAGCAGAVLGLAFFAGLWWTIGFGLRSRRPALWLACSFLLRTGAVLAAFYAIGRGGWERMAACLAGFALARWLTTARVREAVHHAP